MKRFLDSEFNKSEFENFFTLSHQIPYHGFSPTDFHISIVYVKIPCPDELNWWHIHHLFLLLSRFDSSQVEKLTWLNCGRLLMFSSEQIKSPFSEYPFSIGFFVLSFTRVTINLTHSQSHEKKTRIYVLTWNLTQSDTYDEWFLIQSWSSMILWQKLPGQIYIKSRYKHFPFFLIFTSYPLHTFTSLTSSHFCNSTHVTFTQRAPQSLYTLFWALFKVIYATKANLNYHEKRLKVLFKLWNYIYIIFY